MLEAINAMLLDMLAAAACKDYEDRRRRTVQGIQKAKEEGAFKVRRENAKRNVAILDLLKSMEPGARVLRFYITVPIRPIRG